MTNSEQICFLSQAHTTGTFNGIPPAPDLHSNALTNDRSGLTLTDVLHVSLMSFKYRKYQAMSLLKGQHWDTAGSLLLTSPAPVPRGW